MLEIHPVRETGTDCWTRQVRALVLVVDLASRPRVDPDLAGKLPGLKPLPGPGRDREGALDAEAAYGSGVASSTIAASSS